MKAILLGMMVFSLAGTYSAFAHETHCHQKGPDGKMIDVPDAKDRKSCEAKGGTWRHHHPHCHKADGTTDLPEAKDEKACTAQGGKWSDHGHEADSK